MGSPTVTPLQEDFHNAGFLVSESNGHRSRDAITLASGLSVKAGTVLGQITTGTTVTSAALGTNTGNAVTGTITPNTLATQIGTYGLVYTDATHFTVTAPDGATATGVNGTPFSALGIGFTMTTAGAAMVAGDGFTITTVAAIGNPTATSAANAGNTGGSTSSAVTCTGYAPLPGVHMMEFDSATTFIMTDPGGSEYGHGVLASAFSAGGLSFTPSAGATPMVAGDTLQITVGAGSGQWKPWDPANVDGSQIAAGILFGSKVATSAALPAVAITRSAEVNQSELIWASGSNAGQIAIGVAQLKALGIIAR